jgi:phosphoribosyl 1,2-cyclic phosphodiesterase
VETDRFVVRFWGTRGSYPVPGEHTLRYGGNTTCVEIQVGNYPLIVDAGTGLINLGYDLLRRAQQDGKFVPIIATILLTHTHTDHTQGFPYFVPIHIGSSILRILGPSPFQRSLEELLKNGVMPPNFPISLSEMPSLKIVRSLRGTELLALDQEQGNLHIYETHSRRSEPLSNNMVYVRILKSYAHPGGVYVYRIEWRDKSIVFASDVEGYAGIDRRLVDFARDADLLIHDAQYSEADYIAGKQGWGHSTLEMACDVAKMSGAKQLVLFHHSPTYDDDMLATLEKQAQQIFPDTIAAYESLEIAL